MDTSLTMMACHTAGHDSMVAGGHVKLLTLIGHCVPLVLPTSDAVFHSTCVSTSRHGLTRIALPLLQVSMTSWRLTGLYTC